MEQHDLSKIQKLQEKGKSDKIIKYLSSSDDTVVVAALEALSRIKDEDSVNSIDGAKVQIYSGIEQVGREACSNL